ncbi:MAG TPA: serine/threonine-protein kinase [Polyangiaceae bacterium]|nr:serine/threonine-protein kinase [Polyangiaceae bacterium]
MAASPVLVGEVLADKYRVEQVLGQGGMGVVVAAWHVELEQRVAVKFLLPEYAQSREASERFRREARAAVKIQSEHVARVVDVGTMTGGIPYMVMEFLNGHDVSTEIERNGRFPIDEAVDCVLQTSVAIAEAHSLGIVHRDLKPANLFLTRRPDGSRLVKVLDFGISKSLNADSMPQLALTKTAIMVGSPLYMSPEQLESSKQADERADIWSLGVILYELLIGNVPFGGETLPQLVRAVLTGNYTPAKEARPEVPERLSQVIDRCLQIDKHKRISSVADLADALAPFQVDGYRYSERIRRVHTLAGNSKVDPKTRVTGDIPAMSGSASARRAETSAPRTELSPQDIGPPTTDAIPVVEGSDPPPPVHTTGDTGNSWGRTGGRSASAHPGRKSAALWASVGLVALAGAAAAVWLRAGNAQDAPAPAIAPPASIVASPPVVEAPAQPPVKAIVTPQVAAVATSETEPAANSAASASTDAASVAPSSSATQTAAAPRGNQPKVTKKPAQAEPAKAKPQDPFSDFGGRR